MFEEEFGRLRRERPFLGSMCQGVGGSRGEGSSLSDLKGVK